MHNKSESLTGIATLSPLALRIPAACKAIGCGRTHFYDLIRAGEIKTTWVGGRRVVPVVELEKFIARNTHVGTDVPPPAINSSRSA